MYFSHLLTFLLKDWHNRNKIINKRNYYLVLVMKGRDVQWTVEARSYRYNFLWSTVNIISFFSNILIWRLLRNYYKNNLDSQKNMKTSNWTGWVGSSQPSSLSSLPLTIWITWNKAVPKSRPDNSVPKILVNVF